MSTGGYDVVLQVNEDIINRFLNISYCMGLFGEKKGTYVLPLRNVPESLQEFVEIGYEISLEGVPFIDFTEDQGLLLRTRGQAKFIVLGGIEFELEVQFRLKVTPTYDQDAGRLSINNVEAAIDDVELDDLYHLPGNVIERLNEIIAIAIGEYLTEDVTSIPLSPVLFAADLPFMPPGNENRLNIGMGTVRVLSPRVFSAAINLLDYAGGDASALTDFTDGNHVGIGVSEGAMHRVYDFWWDRTTHPKSVEINDTHEFDVPDIVDYLDILNEVVMAIATLGLCVPDTEVDRAWAEYGVTLRFSKFSFNLLPGNMISFAGSVNADIWLRFWVETTTRIYTWGIETGSRTNRIRLFNLRMNGLTINIESEGTGIRIDEENRLTIDLSEVDIDIPLEWEIPEFLLDQVIDWGVNVMLNNMPPIVLSPAVISRTIPSTEITVEASFNKLEINETEVLVAANVETSGIETYSRYIANNDSMEVHLRTCEYAGRIRTDHRAYYCSLEEAFLDGYDGCYYCLPEHHHH